MRTNKLTLACAPPSNKHTPTNVHAPLPSPKKTQAGTHLRKHSPARNLHRLAITLEFILHIFDNLCHDGGLPLRQAVTAAYDATLATIHYWAVRTAVKAGLYSLPARASFFEQIGENEASGMAGGHALIHSARGVVSRLHTIFEGCDMPSSDVKFLPTASFSPNTGGGSAAAAAEAAAS